MTGWLDEAAVARLFEHEVPCVPLGLTPLRAPRVLWLNRQAAARDPWFERLGADPARYEAHLLERCAFRLEEAADPVGPQRGHADRYGGVGIGFNGGSGRAAFVNGYHVKGIGRTPLVSALTDESHASGGAYLEESVRDIVFTEIVRAEFPHSAVPILALIDTGANQVFRFPDRVDVERRVLVVRPAFVRPAHYLRSSFVAADARDGARDAARVAWLFEATVQLRGKAALERDYLELFGRWSRQLAYGFVHRLTHASSTVSNIAIDGRLLDFGAMSALPSWADAAVMMARQPFAAHLQLLPRLVRSSAYYFGRHLDERLASPGHVDALCALVTDEFQRGIVGEALRLLGLERAAAAAAAAGPDRRRWWGAVLQLIAHFERERIDMLESTPALRVPWDLSSVWADEPPPHLRELRRALDALVPAERRGPAARRCRMRSRSRPALYRPEAKRAIFAAVDHSAAGREPCRIEIEALIDRMVAQSRRDSAVEPAELEPIGFACHAGHALLLCRDPRDGRLHAIDEGADMPAAAHAIAALDATTIRFADPERPEFKGAVSLHADLEP